MPCELLVIMRASKWRTFNPGVPIAYQEPTDLLFCKHRLVDLQPPFSHHHSPCSMRTEHAMAPSRVAETITMESTSLIAFLAVPRVDKHLFHHAVRFLCCGYFVPSTKACVYWKVNKESLWKLLAALELFNGITCM